VTSSWSFILQLSFIIALKTDFYLNRIKNFISYLTENTVLLHYEY